jgi:hypothetical protein
MVDKGALRLAQKQLDRLRARANAGELSLKDAHDELEAHEKAVLLFTRTPFCVSNIQTFLASTHSRALACSAPSLFHVDTFNLAAKPCAPPFNITPTQTHARACARARCCSA